MTTPAIGPEFAAQASPAFAGPGTVQNHSLSLCWYGQKIGSFEVVDGDSIKWDGYADPKFANLFTQRESDGMPYFLANMHPDNELYELLEQDDQVTYIMGGLRFLSNLVISKNCPFDHPVQTDQLQTDFPRYVQDGTFNGIYTGPFPIDSGEGLADQLKDYWRNRHVPRFSGAEIKVPATLHEYGVLQPAITTPFTHIIKFPTGSGAEGWGFNEWMSLELSEAAGLKTAQHALLPLGKDNPPAVLVERFDIPGKARNVQHNMFLIQDFCTLAGMGPDDKGLGSMEQVAKVMKQLSTNPQADLEDLFRRAILSVTINDGDMHRKNIAMLFEYNPEEERYVSVRMSPTYDVTSEIWQYDSEQKQTLSLQGKTSGIKAKTMMGFAKAIGLPEDRAQDILTETTTRIAARAVEIARNMPAEAAKHECCQFTAGRIATFAVRNTQMLGGTAPAWDPVEAPKTKMVTTIDGEKILKVLGPAGSNKQNPRPFF